MIANDGSRIRSNYYCAIRPCTLCPKLIWAKGNRLYCDGCQPNVALYRNRCNFRFNVYDYPDRFDLSLIAKHGWYSPTGKHGKNRAKMNLTGVSRDHLFTISDGFRLKVDPMIMSHPANCRLMLHTENNVKNGKSSITLSELLDRVNGW